jgi:hypothetical protein
MSLRAFHLFFIAVSGMLATFCAAWAIGQYRMDHASSYAVGAIISVGCAAALAVYGAMFQRKTRNL